MRRPGRLDALRRLSPAPCLALLCAAAAAQSGRSRLPLTSARCFTGVGKTCLLLRYSNDSFSKTFITTIGIDFKIKYVDLCGKQVKLQIWDTAGQERFRTITTSYFRGAQGILLVYDVTDAVSFSNINNWMSQIHQHADLHVNKILIGNKCDMDEERKVSTEEGRGLAEKCVRGGPPPTAAR